MKNRLIPLIAAVAACLLLDGCHKICTCDGYDGIEHTFTAEEVEQHTGGKCDAMRDFPIENHYSVCHWD